MKGLKLFALTLGIGTICVLGTACHRADTAEKHTEAFSFTVESDTEDQAENVNLGKTPTIPRNQKEQEELFGKTDKSGRWIPPEDSYVDPKTGNTINKEGVVIDLGKPTKPNPNAVG